MHARPSGDSARLRWSDGSDDVACGRLVGRTILRAPYSHLLGTALTYAADPAPLAIPSAYERIVACIERQVLGFAQFQPATGYLKYLFVDPLFQGRRIGARLLAEVEHHVAGSVSLSLLACNEDGRRFYERAGYSILRVEPEADWHGQRVQWLEMGKHA